MSNYRTISENQELFLGDLFQTYFNLSGSLNTAETNEKLAIFMSETKFDIFSKYAYDPTITYDINYDSGTGFLLGSEVFRVFEFFPNCQEMVYVIDQLRIKGKSSIQTIFQWSLTKLSFNAVISGVAGSSIIAETWHTYYTNKNVLGTRNSKGLSNPNGLSTTDIAGLFTIYSTKPSNASQYIETFVGAFGFSPSADMTTVEVNALMTNIFTINRLGVWEDKDISYVGGFFVGADVDGFKLSNLTEKIIFDLMQKLMSLGYTYDEVLLFDIPFAATLYENYYLAMQS